MKNLGKKEALKEAFKDVCPLCNNTGIVADKLTHQFHTCWKCMGKGKLDQDTKEGNQNGL